MKRLWLPALSIGVIAAGFVIWYLSPTEHAARLKSMDIRALIVYTARHPKDGEALLALARRMELQDHQEEAFNDYIQAGKLLPGNESAWIGAAHAAMHIGDATAAMQMAQKAAQAAPDSANAQIVLGDVYTEIGAWKPAQQSYRKATRLDGRNAIAWDALGQAALRREDLAEATQAANQAVRLDPHNGSFQLHLEYALRAEGDITGAQRAMAQALRCLPHNGDVLTAYGQLLADTAYTPQRQKQAEQELKQAATVMGASSAAYKPLYDLGQLCLSESRPADAAGAFRAALRDLPEDQAAVFGLSRALALQGETQEATAVLTRFRRESSYQLEVSHLQMRLGREPDRVDLLNQLARLYAEHGFQQEAVPLLQRSLTLNPHQPDLRRLLKTDLHNNSSSIHRSQ